MEEGKDEQNCRNEQEKTRDWPWKEIEYLFVHKLEA